MPRSGHSYFLRHLHWRTPSSVSIPKALLPSTFPRSLRTECAGAQASAEGKAQACASEGSLSFWTYCRTSHQYSWIFEADAVKAQHDSIELTFSRKRGGNQGAEGDDTGQGWFVQNDLSLLDAEGEYFYDVQAEMLYMHSANLPSELVVPSLANIIELRGTPAQPVRNVTLRNLGLVANRPTILEPRMVPSGSDWAVELPGKGAVYAEGTVDLRVEGCDFRRLDTHAVFLYGFNRRATVERCVFESLGQSAVISLGKAEHNDGSGGEQPRFSRILGNWATDIGQLQVQSSLYFQALTCQSLTSGNIAFNVPRAAILFADSFGGSSNVTRNLLFSTCSRSQDHAAFNAWARVPYVSDLTDPPSSAPLVSVLEQNLIVNNEMVSPDGTPVGADAGCFDTDDGAHGYEMRGNVCFFGGHKSLDGHSKSAHHNLYVFPAT